MQKATVLQLSLLTLVLLHLSHQFHVLVCFVPQFCPYGQSVTLVELIFLKGGPITLSFSPIARICYLLETTTYREEALPSCFCPIHLLSFLSDTVSTYLSILSLAVLIFMLLGFFFFFFW